MKVKGCWRRGWQSITCYPGVAKWKTYECEVCGGKIDIGDKYFRAGERIAHPKCAGLPEDRVGLPQWLSRKQQKEKEERAEAREKRDGLNHRNESSPLQLHPPVEVTGNLRLDKMIEGWEEQLRVITRRIERLEKAAFLEWDGR